MISYQILVDIERKNDKLQEATYNLRTFGLPVIIFSGCLLNLISFFVMRRIRYSATSFLMCILAIVDSSVLLTGALSSWLFQLNKKLPVIFMSNIGCKAFTFLSYTTLDLSVCLVVIMTAERFYAVSRPLHVQQLLERGQSFKIIFGSAFMCALVNSHFLYTYSLKTIDDNDENQLNICTYIRWESFYKIYWVFIDACIYSFIPFVLLTILNVSIIKSLINASKKRKNMKFESTTLSFRERQTRMSVITRSSLLKSPKSCLNLERIQLANKTRRHNGINKRLTKRLLLINISFCILSMPISILQIMNHFNDKRQVTESNTSTNWLTEQIIGHLNDYQMKYIMDLLKAIAELLQYLNHGTNFFLYILSGRTFRQETKLFFKSLIKIFNCKRKNVNSIQYE
jgi:hypothetical protein